MRGSDQSFRIHVAHLRVRTRKRSIADTAVRFSLSPSFFFFTLAIAGDCDSRNLERTSSDYAQERSRQVNSVQHRHLRSAAAVGRVVGEGGCTDLSQAWFLRESLRRPREFSARRLVFPYSRRTRRRDGGGGEGGGRERDVWQRCRSKRYCLRPRLASLLEAEDLVSLRSSTKACLYLRKRVKSVRRANARICRVRRARARACTRNKRRLASRDASEVDVSAFTMTNVTRYFVPLLCPPQPQPFVPASPAPPSLLPLSLEESPLVISRAVCRGSLELRARVPWHFSLPRGNFTRVPKRIQR